MTRLHPSSPRACLVLGLGLLVALALVEFAAYPSLATSINRALGDGQTPDSSMGYFRDVYVGRGLIAFLLASLTALALAAGKGHRALHTALVILVAVNVLCFAGSALWYFREIAAAAGAVSH